MFVQDLEILLRRIDTLVLKLREILTVAVLGNTNARLQGHGGNPLHTCLGSPLRRSRSRRIPGAVAEEYQDKNSLPSARLFLVPVEGLLLQ